MTRMVPGIVALLLLPIAATPARAQTMKLGEVLVFNVVDLKPAADTAGFAAYVNSQVAPAWKSAAPGSEVHLVRADRGSRKGQHLLAWMTDTQARHGKYASTAPDGSPFNAELRAQLSGLRAGAEPFVNSGGSYLEYHLLSPAKVGPLPEVEILGIHYIKVQPERREAFERFVDEKLHPAVANLRPDLRLLYYKSVRGEDAGSYITIIALTNASRDKYWPNGSDSDAVRAAFAPVKALTPELRSYLVEGSYLATETAAAMVFESREWTDFVAVVR